jgi:hypothetical protein
MRVIGRGADGEDETTEPRIETRNGRRNEERESQPVSVKCATTIGYNIIVSKRIILIYFY